MFTAVSLIVVFTKYHELQDKVEDQTESAITALYKTSCVDPLEKINPHLPCLPFSSSLSSFFPFDKIA